VNNFSTQLLCMAAFVAPTFLFMVGIAVRDELKQRRERKRYKRWIERLGRERQWP
jgi:hypothetical protein